MAHFTHVIDVNDIPREAIEDCTVGGQDASDPVTHWVATLDFTVDRDAAIKCLRGYGAWDQAELDDMDDTDIAERVFWLACGTFNEGDDIFCLE